jgi:osmotically-inducible protein OsmY
MKEMQTAVANALHWDLAVPRHSVTADVDSGWVILQGVVERAYQKSCAEADVRRVKGVIGVRNEIAVRSVKGVSVPSLPTPMAFGWADPIL